jgi:hypothetical protein
MCADYTEVFSSSSSCLGDTTSGIALLPARATGPPRRRERRPHWKALAQRRSQRAPPPERRTTSAKRLCFPATTPPLLLAVLIPARSGAKQRAEPPLLAADAVRARGRHAARAVPPGTRGGHRGRIFGASAKSTWVRDCPACARLKRPKNPFLAESKKPGQNWSRRELRSGFGARGRSREGMVPESSLRFLLGRRPALGALRTGNCAWHQLKAPCSVKRKNWGGRRSGAGAKKLAIPCPGCGAVFDARELRAHLPECLKTSKTAKMAKRKNPVKIGRNWGRRGLELMGKKRS